MINKAIVEFTYEWLASFLGIEEGKLLEIVLEPERRTLKVIHYDEKYSEVFPTIEGNYIITSIPEQESKNLEKAFELLCELRKEQKQNKPKENK